MDGGKLIENKIWDDVEEYFKDMSNFNARRFIDHIKPMDKMDWCSYMIGFNNVLHKDDFMADMMLFSATFKHGLRPDDVYKENVHHLKEYLEEIKKGDKLFQEYAIQSLMPIRYYFKEDIKGIVEYFNAEVDKLDLTDKEKLRNKFLVHDLLKS